jgi:hypothetical protein
LDKRSETIQKQSIASMARRQKMPMDEIMRATTRFLQKKTINPKYGLLQIQDIFYNYIV